jgi:hypothetical protein
MAGASLASFSRLLLFLFLLVDCFERVSDLLGMVGVIVVVVCVSAAINTLAFAPAHGGDEMSERKWRWGAREQRAEEGGGTQQYVFSSPKLGLRPVSRPVLSLRDGRGSISCRCQSYNEAASPTQRVGFASGI